MQNQRTGTSLESDNFRQALEQALHSLAEIHEAGFIRQLKLILLKNLDRGRLQSFTEGRLDHVSAYVGRVANSFSTLQPYLTKLQSERDPETWAPLFERMQTWAYNFLLRKGFAAEERTRELAAERATEAAVTILNAHFPYDTDFDPWAHILVQNTCRKFIHRELKKSEVPAEQMVELHENLVNPTDFLLELQTLQKEAGSEIVKALGQLSEARRSVIQSIYFEEMAPEEVAQQMGKSVGAIYSLQFHALQDLRKILSTIRDNPNE
jgi:RNA polymerase sigma factor (sigma-70 family)